MRETVEKDSQGLVELLAQDYQSRHRAELKQKVGQISQDCISRGLFNTTVRVGDQLRAEMLYVEGLVDYVLASLEPEVSRISLAICKQALLQIVENEYRKIISGIGGKLIASNLVSGDIIDGFERESLKRCEEAKKRIEVRFEAWEKQEALHRKARERWYQNRTIQGTLVTAGVALLLAVMGWLITSRDRAQVDVYLPPRTGTELKRPDEDASRVLPSEPNTRARVDSSPAPGAEMGVQRRPTPTKSETILRSEEVNADVNAPNPKPVLRIRSKPLVPEEPNGEVTRPEQMELLRKKRSHIKPDAS